MSFHPFEGLLQPRFRTVPGVLATVCSAADLGRNQTKEEVKR
jgi:hypothetical protein